MSKSMSKRDQEYNLPWYGHVYFLVSDCGTHVKIGASDVPGRRFQSILWPQVDWQKSVLIRYPNWQAAYAVEQRLHKLLARERDKEFFILPEHLMHRQREGEAGKHEWFHIEALQQALAIVEDPAFVSVFGAGRTVPALELVRYRTAIGAEDSYAWARSKQCTASYKAAEKTVGKLLDVAVGKIVCSQPSAANDDFSVMLAVPDSAAVMDIVKKGRGQELSFIDRHNVPLLGKTVELPGSSLVGVEIASVRPNAIERGRELNTLCGINDRVLAAPPLEELGKADAEVVREAAGMEAGKVNGHVPGEVRFNRWRPAPEQQPTLFDVAPA
ncbi:MAG: GIY-YIG nuclease family protein [Bdellovibrionales bacterium]